MNANTIHTISRSNKGNPMIHAGALTIHIDGAARDNPGPAAFAFVIAQEDAAPIEEKGYLGSTTNNVAEYTALVRALERAAQLEAKRLVINSDSELLVKQMNGEYRVKNPDLKRLYDQAKRLCKQFDRVVIRHVPRSENSEADALCNEVLDEPALRSRSSSSKEKVLGAGRKTAQEEAVREEAILCLKAAASSWAQGNSNDPPAEDVWDQIWSILEEQGVLRRRPSG